MKRFITSVAGVFMALTAIACAGADAADAYPTRPVRLIYGFVPGGTAGSVAFAVGQKLTDALGKQVIVDSRPGAASNIAAALTAKSTPDGYTIFLMTVTNTVNASLYRKLPFDVVRDFEPVSQVITAPHLLVVHPSVPAKSVGELVTLAKAKPGALNFGNAGSGSTAHMAAALFESLAGIDIVHVAYKGTSQALTDLLGGQTQGMFSDLLSAAPHLKSGKLRPLGMSVPAGKRSRQMPDLPSIAESGVPNFESGTWVGIVAPAGTPPRIIERLNRGIVKGFSEPETQAQMTALGLDIVANSPAEFKAVIARDVERFRKLVQALNLNAD